MLFSVIFLGYYNESPDAGYTVKDGSGTVVIARTTSGVIDLGGNAFQVVISDEELPVPSVVIWDDGLGINAEPIAYNGSGGGSGGNVVIIKDDLGCG